MRCGVIEAIAGGFEVVDGIEYGLQVQWWHRPGFARLDSRGRLSPDGFILSPVVLAFSNSFTNWRMLSA